MNDEIRKILIERIDKEYRSRGMFARAAGVTPNYLSDVLLGVKIKTPEKFGDILDKLNLTLTVTEKPKPENGGKS